MSTEAARLLPQHDATRLRSIGCIVGVDRAIACAARQLGAADTLALLDGDIAPLRRANLFSEGALLVAADMDRLHLSALDAFADWLEYEVENEDRNAAGRSGLLVFGGSAPWDTLCCGSALMAFADRVIVAQPIAASTNNGRVRTLGFHLFRFVGANRDEVADASKLMMVADPFTAADTEAAEALEFTLQSGTVAVVGSPSSPRSELARLLHMWESGPRSAITMRWALSANEEDGGGGASNDASSLAASKHGVELVLDAPPEAAAFVRDALVHSGFVASSSPPSSTSDDDEGDAAVTVRLHQLPSMLLVPASHVGRAAVLPCARGAVLRLRLLVDALARLEEVTPTVQSRLLVAAPSSHLERHASDSEPNDHHLRLCTVVLRAPGVLAADDREALQAYGNETRARFLQRLREVATSGVCSCIDVAIGSVVATRALAIHIVIPSAAGAAGILHVAAAAAADVVVATLRAAVAWAWDYSPTVLASTEERVAAAVAATRKRLAQSDARVEAAAAAAAGSWWDYVGMGGEALGGAAAAATEDAGLDDVDDEEDGVVEAVTFSLDGSG